MGVYLRMAQVPLGFCYGVSSAASAHLELELVGEEPLRTASARSHRALVQEAAPHLRKMAAILVRLEEGPEPDDSLVLCVDGTDIWFTPRATPTALLAAYDALGSKEAVLVHTERDCFPTIRDSCEYYPPGHSSFRYANSGGFLGARHSRS